MLDQPFLLVNTTRTNITIFDILPDSPILLPPVNNYEFLNARDTTQTHR